jgi:hypothetical protein
MAQRRKNDRDATARDRTPTLRVQPAPVTSDQIARHAYALYRARGGAHGHDVEDWLQAERELQPDPEC